jgi:uncharacterized protein (DUF2249 family)
MTGVVETLRERHGELSALAASVSRAVGANDWRGYRDAVANLRERVLSLIAYEDEDLLPALSGSEHCEPLATLRAEHAALRELVDELAAASPAHDPEGCRAELERLAGLLRAHDRSSSKLFDSPALRAVPAPAASLREQTRPLDMRDLEPPEPLMRILDAIEREPGKTLTVVLRHEPFPLYELLRQRGCRYRGQTRADGGFELVIEPGPKN